MRDHQFQLGSRWIGGDRPCYVIAEIGQNHQGDMELAKRMIVAAKDAGADCVKFQASHLPAKFTAATLAAPYTSPHAWAPTYGEHKARLEFDRAQFAELQRFAEQRAGIAFTASAMDAVALDALLALPAPVPFIKIGSGDANNIPLLERATAGGRPLVISTGMLTERMIRRIVQIQAAQAGGGGGSRDFALLHCVSAYPVRAVDVRLRMVGVLRQWFPGVCIGYSGHELGVAVTAAAVVLGAKVIERHFTLDPTLKGTDHRLSLTPPDLRRLVDNIRRLEATMTTPPPTATTDPDVVAAIEDDADPFDRVCAAFAAAAIPLSDDERRDIRDAVAPLAGRTSSDPEAVVADCERPCWLKLGKSLVFARTLTAGHCVRADDVCFKVTWGRKGLLDGQYDAIMGRRLRADVAYEEPVAWEHFASEDE